MHRLAILSSSTKSAHISRTIINACRSGEIPNSSVQICIGSTPDAAVLLLANELGIGSLCISLDPRERELLACLRENSIDTVILAGYIKKIRAPMLQAFPARILNAHPGPLRFGGKGMFGVAVQHAVLAADARTTGPTIHIVDELYDHGKILGSEPIAIAADDTPSSLNDACNAAIPALYVRVLQNFLQDA